MTVHHVVFLAQVRAVEVETPTDHLLILTTIAYCSQHHVTYVKPGILWSAN